MGNNGVGTICKWLSILLVVVSMIITLFFGAVWVTDKDELPEWKEEAQDVIDEWNSNYGTMQQELDSMNINIDIKKIFVPVLNIIKAFKDGKISAFEEYRISKETYKLAKLIIEEKDLRQFIGAYSYETAEAAKSNRILIGLLFYLTIIAGVGVVAFHVMNHKFPGVSVVIINLAWLFFWEIATDGDSELFTFNLGLYYHMKIASSVIISLILSIIAMLFWIVRNKTTLSVSGIGHKTNKHLYSVSSVVKRHSQNGIRKSRAADPNAVKCNNCGRQLRPGAVFCPSCGTKYVEPVRQEQPVYQTDNTISSVQENEFCPNCGAELDSDAIFCGSCGYKRS